MGKIRIKHVGFGELEKEEKRKEKLRRSQKKEKKKTARAPGLKGGERVVAVGPTPEEVEKELKKEVEPQKGTFETPKTPKLPKQRSSRYQKLAKLIDKNKLYSPSEAFKILKKMANTNFTGTVEAHISLKRAAGKSEQAGHEPALQAETRRQLDSQPALSLHFEKKFPLVHAVLGKTNHPVATLEENLKTLIKKVNPQNIKKLTLSTTMSPSLKIAFSPN